MCQAYTYLRAFYANEVPIDSKDHVVSLTAPETPDESFDHYTISSLDDDQATRLKFDDDDYNYSVLLRVLLQGSSHICIYVDAKKCVRINSSKSYYSRMQQTRNRSNSRFQFLASVFQSVGISQ
ncbi:hypothetical protein V1478_007351 [Vespula squamosa]|uniref:Uncharacterized protein n=1 Tax=Vespula squamosa TaxID=30214 RepID=A0ABD2B2Z2_VESSQ